MKRSPKGPPTHLSECETGTIARTVAGVLVVLWRNDLDRLPVCRLLHPETFRELSDPWVLKLDLEVLEVLRDQSYYRSHARAGSGEVDPLKKGTPR